LQKLALMQELEPERWVHGLMRKMSGVITEAHLPEERTLQKLALMQELELEPWVHELTWKKISGVITEAHLQEERTLRSLRQCWSWSRSRGYTCWGGC
jgi:hypothetical protein